MNLIARARYRLCYGSLSQHIYSPVIASGLHKSVTRHLAQAATSEKEEEEEEEVEIDQRRLPADYDPNNFDPTEHRSPPSARVWTLVDEMAGLTVAESAEFGIILQRKMGIKGLYIGVMKPGAGGVPGGAIKGAAAAAAAAKDEKKPEKTAFELKIESFDAASKLKVIKEIRSITDLGLKEAKELVEKAPVIFKTGVSKAEAEQIIEKMKAIGAKVALE